MIGITLVLLLLLGFAAAELFWPKKVFEGFDNLVSAVSPSGGYFANFVPRRGDITEGNEEGGYVQDPRYFRGYVDVQRLGLDHDFCRMVESKSDKSKFFACALAGTENLSSLDFRTPSTKEKTNDKFLFILSRDDYMRDINKDGRADYCRILKGKSGVYEPQCNRALDHNFDSALVVDTNPPSDIVTLTRFYQGCVFWYRFYDDMLDYVNNTQIMVMGGGRVDEKPNPKITEALRFNGLDQYLRIGDSPDLELGAVVPLRSMRGFMVWVYFEEFTNNAKIFDFGDGPGKNNVMLGIIGKGDPDPTSQMIRNAVICDSQNTVPSSPSGPQPGITMSPQDLMRSTSANVEFYECTDLDIPEVPRRIRPSKAALMPKQTATLLYEVWDERQRKLCIKVPGVIKKGTWTHIAITATSSDAFRPNIGIYVDGKQVFVEPSGFLPQTSTLSNCYIGKSNWANETSQYANKDELFNGRIFDLRGYKSQVSENLIKDSIAWGKAKLGL